MLKGTGKRGHIVSDTLLLMLCFHAAQTGKHLLRTQNVSEQNQKHFLCPGHKICVRKARANRETFVSATTLCPQQCVLVCQGLNMAFKPGLSVVLIRPIKGHILKSQLLI